MGDETQFATPSSGRSGWCQDKGNWTKQRKQFARNSKEAKARPQIACSHSGGFCDANKLTQSDIEGK